MDSNSIVLPRYALPVVNQPNEKLPFSQLGARRFTASHIEWSDSLLANWGENDDDKNLIDDDLLEPLVRDLVFRS